MPPDPFLILPTPSTTSPRQTVKLTGRASGQERVRRRRADPLGGARLYGPRTPVSVTLTIRSGADMWLEVRAPNGVFFTSPDVCAYDLMQQIITGGHFVREERQRPSTTRSRRSGRGSIE
jgi:hypothetical protein